MKKAGIASALCHQLAAAKAAEVRGNLKAKAGAILAYTKTVSAQSGKALTAGQANILISLAKAL